MLRRIESWPEWKIAFVLTAAARGFYSAVAAVFSFFLHPDPARVASNALTENLASPGTWHYPLLGVWERFDTLWYLHIASHGYDQPHAVIFYPLYPAAIHAISWVMPVTAAALLVATAGAFFFFWAMARLARQHSTGGTLRTLLVVCAWPAAYVMFSGYAESLTMALVVWAIVLGRNERWWQATACGILAGLCRPSGVLVAVPLIVLAMRSRRWSSVVVLFTPAGTLAYWTWLHFTGRPSVVEAYRVYQGSTFAPPWASLREVLRLIVTEQQGLLAVKLGLLVLTVMVCLRGGLRIEDRLFAFAVILQMLMYTGRPLLGTARYLLPVYPAFLVLGEYATRTLSWRRFAVYWFVFELVNLTWMWAFLNWDLRFI